MGGRLVWMQAILFRLEDRRSGLLKDIGSNSSGVNDCRSDHQSFADIDVNTGTDTYIRPETAGNYACTDDYGTVAAE